MNHQQGNNDDSDGSTSNFDKYLFDTFGEPSSESSNILAEDSRNNDGISRAGQRGEISMGKFAEQHNEAYQDLAKEIEKMGNKFFDYVLGQSIDHSRRYVSDVILFNNERELYKLVSILCQYGKSRRNGMFGYSVENDHIHVIHDCSFSDGTCRDSWRKQVEAVGHLKPIRRQNKLIGKLGRTDWYDVFIYFFLAKRGTRQIWIRGESWQEPSHAQLVRWEEKYNSWRQMVRVQDSGNNLFGERQDNKRTSRALSISSNDEVYGKRSKSSGKFSYIRQKTKEMVLKYYTCPISAIQTVKEWRDDDILMNPKNKDLVNTAFIDFGQDLISYSLRDFYNLFYNGEIKNPLFAKLNYGTLEQSVEVIDQLLKFQFDNDEERVQEFLVSLVDVLDKRLAKCNTLSVKSPPSAGKNFFFDMIFAILNNYGQLGQANRHNVFAFQEAPNKRVLLWNEPNYCSSLTDTIKMMLGSDSYTVRVKFQLDTHVERTPVIILTNNHVNFLSDISFRERIVKYEWKYAEFLKDIEFKPYPLAFFEMLKKYNIEF